jgi:hypothetical protein
VIPIGPPTLRRADAPLIGRESMNPLPPSDLVMNNVIAARAAIRWADTIGGGGGAALGRNLRFESGNSVFAIHFPEGVPDGFHEREDATSSAMRCLRVVAATRHTPESTWQRIQDDLLGVSHHAWALAMHTDPTLHLDEIVTCTATPWSRACVYGTIRGERDRIDITPPSWTANSPRIVMTGRYSPGLHGYWMVPPSAKFETGDTESTEFMRRSIAGSIACSAGHRWTMPGDEIWRKPSKVRRIRR